MSVKKAVFIALAFIVSVYAAPSFAIYERTLPLKAELEKAARGTVEVENDEDVRYRRDYVKLTITAKGLKPYSVYTVWLRRDEPERTLKGLGVADYSFTTDGKGTGRFIASLPDYELRYWDTLEIDYHPGKDPKDRSDAQAVLTADLRPAHY